MAKLEDAQRRSAVIAERIWQRTDVALRRAIAEFEGELNFLPLADLMISEKAWTHVTSSEIDPNLYSRILCCCARILALPNITGGSPFCRGSA